MYLVVGCAYCRSVKIVDDNTESATCNRCGSNLRVAELEQLFSSNDIEEAKEARSILLARRNGLDFLSGEMMDTDAVSDEVKNNLDIGAVDPPPEETEITEVELEEDEDDGTPQGRTGSIGRASGASPDPRFDNTVRNSDINDESVGKDSRGLNPSDVVEGDEKLDKTDELLGGSRGGQSGGRGRDTAKSRRENKPNPEKGSRTPGSEGRGSGSPTETPGGDNPRRNEASRNPEPRKREGERTPEKKPEGDKTSEPKNKADNSRKESPDRRIVMDAIEFLDEPTDDDVMDFAEERGVDPATAEEIVDDLCMNGEAMRKRDGVIKLLE